MPLRLDIHDPGFDESLKTLLAAKREAASDVDATVRAIIADVRKRGDKAIVAYTERFDHVSLTPDTLQLSSAEIRESLAQCRAEDRRALEVAAERITDFHRRQLPSDFSHTDAEDVHVGWRWTPVDSVGLYVPGGTAAYPSSVLMNALPARVAGVERLVMTVPTPRGIVNPLVMAAAGICGITEVLRIGGAQAVAALAYGTERIAAVDKIVGPGNAYVAAAKRSVFGHVGIDSVAGPSEVLIIADSANDPQFMAVDLLAQAEHDESAQSILITDSVGFADAVAAAVCEQLSHLSRRAIAEASWAAHGALITVDHLSQAVPIVNRIAPEHLQLAISTPEDFARCVRHAGAIFLGRWTPEALGDYVAGPNHVLPTARSARFSSGLGVLDFLKRTTIVGCSERGLAAIGPTAITLAEAEGLTAHARSVALRLNRRR